MQQQGVLVILVDPRFNRPNFVADQHVIPFQHNSRLCNENDKDGKENEEHDNPLNIYGDYHESKIQYFLKEQGNGQIWLQYHIEEQQYRPSFKVCPGTYNYYVEDIVDKNEQQARIVTPQRKVESFINL